MIDTLIAKYEDVAPEVRMGDDLTNLFKYTVMLTGALSIPRFKGLIGFICREIGGSLPWVFLYTNDLI